MGMAASWLDDTAAFNGLNYTLVHFYCLYTLMPAPSASSASRADLSRRGRWRRAGARRIAANIAKLPELLRKS
jgi:hypothetical protein